MRVVFVVFVDQFRKPLILLTFLEFGLVDRLWFLRVVLWFCGSLVVFGSRVAHCVSETGKATRSGINQGEMRVPCAKRTACKMARVAPTPSKKTAKRRTMWFFGEIVVFWRDCGFLASLWFLPSLWFLGDLVVFVGFVVFAVFVVFGRACGSPFQSRDKGQTAKGFDDRVEVVLSTGIGGGYEYD